MTLHNICFNTIGNTKTATDIPSANLGNSIYSIDLTGNPTDFGSVHPDKKNANRLTHTSYQCSQVASPHNTEKGKGIQLSAAHDY